MSLPPLAPFPPTSLRLNIVPEEWEVCLQAWISLTQGYLALPTKTFKNALTLKYVSVTDFLASYMLFNADENEVMPKTAIEKDLRRQCFLLAHRTITDIDPTPPPLLGFSFLADMSIVYARTSSLPPLLGHILSSGVLLGGRLMADHRKKLSSILTREVRKDDTEAQTLIRQSAALLKASPDYGRFLMTGSDIVDELEFAWCTSASDMQRKITIIAYRALLALLKGPHPQASLLLDHLYTLKITCEQQQIQSSPKLLLAELVSNTPLLHKLLTHLPNPHSGRTRSLISHLESLATSTGIKPKKYVRRKVNKGKGADHDEYGCDAVGSVHIHKMSLITQVQDLFPDLGSGFIVKLLDEYENDPEQVTAHLLDDSLPPHLRNADRTEDFASHPAAPTTDLAPDLAPRSTPPLPSTRRNIFDNDDFDKLAISTTSLHKGRKELSFADTPAPSKAAILSALAAFDSDDDERDDTYDVEDVGGTVDVQPHSEDADDVLNDNNSEALFAAWKLDSKAFNRDKEMRQSQARIALRNETKMTDEMIEGWAIMLQRNPKRLRGLEARFSTFDGMQKQIAATSWRANDDGATTTEDEDGDGSGPSRGGFRGRGGRGIGGGRGREIGGRGGSDVAGPANEQGTRVARQRKDANKGSRANHNRRDQRARKIARAGFPG